MGALGSSRRVHEFYVADKACGHVGGVVGVLGALASVQVMPAPVPLAGGSAGVTLTTPDPSSKLSVQPSIRLGALASGAVHPLTTALDRLEVVLANAQNPDLTP